MTHASLVLRATQQTALTPRLQQSVRLLQLSSNDFAQELEQALATNPFLEVPAATDGSGALEYDDAWSASPEGGSTRQVSDYGDAGGAASSLFDHGAAVDPHVAVDAPALDHSSVAGVDDAIAPSSAEASDFMSTGAQSGAGDGQDTDVGAWAEAASTLRMHLHAELAGYRVEPRALTIAEMVIEALDDDGYLRQDLDEVADHFAFDPPVDGDELATALKLVQQFGPPGIAARGVGECLALQLEALLEGDCVALRPGLDATSIPVALTMVREHLEQVAARDWSGIRRRIGCSLTMVTSAAEVIRSLDPRPGSAFGGDVAQSVIPDVIVRRIKGGWHADINPEVIPKLSLNRVYAALFHDARGGDRQPLGQQLQEARWLLRNTAQRFVTIRRVARIIVAEQAAFLDYGDIAIRPLLLRQVADQLDLHESTISRAIGNKFMATPRGVFAFKHFFSRKLATVSGGSCSATSIRAAMRELIDGEERADPLSDVMLAKCLTDQGLCVARRTVTKYRGLMRIPAVELRRHAT